MQNEIMQTLSSLNNRNATRIGKLTIFCGTGFIIAFVVAVLLQLEIDQKEKDLKTCMQCLQNMQTLNVSMAESQVKLQQQINAIVNTINRDHTNQ